MAGVAIGLAAQNIVKDCFNGFLILVEDQYNVGDVVTIAGVTGNGGGDDAAADAGAWRRRDAVHRAEFADHDGGQRDAGLHAGDDPGVGGFSANPDEVMALLKEVAMSVREDPKYSDVYLADPTLLGVDAIKGSQVIYPVQLRTKANQQWAAMRETQRRIRLALEEHGMLPGDPMRVYGKGSGQRTADSGQDAVRHGGEPGGGEGGSDDGEGAEGNPFGG